MFFLFIIPGSSTDLAPSVIAYYDRLSTSIDSNSNSSDSVNLSTATLHGEPLPAHPNTSLKTESTQRLPVTSPPSNTSTPTKHRNFRVLSHNVQRMISHTSATVDECTDIEQLGTPTAISTPNPKSTSKRPSSTIGIKQIKHPPIHLPLSKNTCKLTQAQGNELVDAFDAITGDLPDDRKTPTNLIEDHDTNKTPINKNRSFLFENGYRDRAKPLSDGSSPALTSIDERKGPKSTKIRKIVERLQAARSNNAALSAEKSGNKMVKKSNRSTGAEESDSSDDQFVDCIAEASNMYVNVPKTSQNAPSDSGKTELKDDEERTPPPKADIEELSGVTVEKEPTDKPISKHSPRTSPSAKPKKLLFAADTVDGKPTTTVHPQQLVIPDLARLKHRPLSASSICSTSSTSSSGSERLAGKHGVSYLASVESLADESELVNSGLTLCERACMEIIDSEKSYVDDLGQVIKGYLADWKEGACLRTDELRILFSNIEKVYAFNSVLLEQLVAAGSDPVGIARCFVELKDRFDVYTTYW